MVCLWVMALGVQVFALGPDLVTWGQIFDDLVNLDSHGLLFNK